MAAMLGSCLSFLVASVSIMLSAWLAGSTSIKVSSCQGGGLGALREIAVYFDPVRNLKPCEQLVLVIETSRGINTCLCAHVWPAQCATIHPIKSR